MSNAAASGEIIDEERLLAAKEIFAIKGYSGPQSERSWQPPEQHKAENTK
jgi:hypothetical protein